MEIYLSILVAVIGAIAFLVAKHADYKEAGRIMFFCGLLAFLLGPVPARVFSVIQR